MVSPPRSVRDADALHQVVEPGITAQTFEIPEDFEPHKKACALLKSPFQPFESYILVPETRMSAREPERRDAIWFSILLNFLRELARLSCPTYPRVHDCGVQEPDARSVQREC